MRVAPPGPESRIYRPAELNQEVRLHLEAGFPRLWLEAELSNLARPASGHLYFTLKDARAQIRCALFRGNASALGFRPENGQQVLVRGRLSLYEARGDYQLIADAMLEAGAGQLQKDFEALRRKLASEGLFEEARKQALPRWPRRIALVTSPSGAAVRDLLKVLGERWPAAEIRIYAATVQGETAPASLIRALRAADRHEFADLIILARGGGSLEDLWAFNDEGLARAIADCRTPIISGVGHETDTTIADYVADLRAATPSAAAAAATPDGPALRLSLQRLDAQLSRSMQARLDRLDQTSDHLARRLATQHPARRLDETRRRLDACDRRASLAMNSLLEHGARSLTALDLRLSARHPARRLDRATERVSDLERRLRQAQHRMLRQADRLLASRVAQLNAVSPLSVLERGYGIVRDRNRQALVHREDFIKSKKISILMNSFEVDAEVSAAPRDAKLS
ncbi:exodeoxyribonuclease VII large subunit [Wenzhouxiangella marina]|uniref:exodeoxyribonuclease VII large subunit n=1 Tax=Wenzhouxiangella marina TaxID=1579979 RepID=UPI00067331F4|nr:exodeoxyribonuclease VII large subunit [Wenzhouxiangella marina]MBB6086122.1 exodeoxyribonuclease VII large subunit [Wenzhouxiangella marina]